MFRCLACCGSKRGTNSDPCVGAMQEVTAHSSGIFVWVLSRAVRSYCSEREISKDCCSKSKFSKRYCDVCSPHLGKQSCLKGCVAAYTGPVRSSCKSTKIQHCGNAARQYVAQRLSGFQRMVH
ncbi:hypothetical protein HBI56_234100 [Parastagonospora nodorum]|uniref:Uncharacterized protein n=1 Tax=Phaeosphaeria nodorum (strain SN15 / ATCC MYA-4574 / FGSC 10173) TaxID=321614 RepID=A0A7U2I7Y7_PHANO|nr:hypothetical protein HBH56_241270 [Parastagonospora nodorum]QRD03787.1 hypothetical protein JI435_420280 [Parastagonospora nodorum SN15]KAH3921268.1 hypothetical protein HBH54_243130 [Parastagonospora nodorum]KAH3939048.1 hypothetical protein HBH53_241060 [Parastagonospora nodorum]KAH3968378.1 hypothetical protein HBH52_181520 [Parastagonospora nodorum]